jgi:mono/diheme cytochrome c family protein
MILIAILLNLQMVTGQTGKGSSSSIPENINKIFNTSCIQCHGRNGKTMALARINFPNWAAYSVVKQAEKASLICSTLSKGAMPPKPVRESKPELNPTKEQIDLICTWAESLNSKMKK